MRITWDWKDLWEFFNAIEDIQNKVSILKQLDANFVRGISFERQAEMFLHAPLEILNNISHLLKPEAIQLLNLEKKKKFKKLRR